MITDSRAVAARSLILVIVGWLRVVHSQRMCTSCCWWQDTQSSS